MSMVTLTTPDSYTVADTLARVFATYIERRQRESGPLAVDTLESLFSDFQSVVESQCRADWDLTEIVLPGNPPRSVYFDWYAKPPIMT